MWSLAHHLLDGSIVSSLDEIRRAMRIVAERNHVISEGVGACAVAAGLSGKCGRGKIVCVVSGGNIDLAKFLELVTRPDPSALRVSLYPEPLASAMNVPGPDFRFQNAIQAHHSRLFTAACSGIAHRAVYPLDEVLCQSLAEAAEKTDRPSSVVSILPVEVDRVK